jgi:flagellum-specific ATP synthase
MARFLRQTTHSKVNLAESLVQLEQLMGVMGYEPASSL